MRFERRKEPQERAIYSGIGVPVFRNRHSYDPAVYSELYVVGADGEWGSHHARACGRQVRWMLLGSLGRYGRCWTALDSYGSRCSSRFSQRGYLDQPHIVIIPRYFDISIRPVNRHQIQCLRRVPTGTWTMPVCTAPVLTMSRDARLDRVGADGAGMERRQLPVVQLYTY